MTQNSQIGPGNKDEYRTPLYIFNWLNEKFGPFDVDICANRNNALCDSWIGIQGFVINGNRVTSTDPSSSALTVDWHSFGDRGYNNPPYSRPGPFFWKALEEANKYRFQTTMLTNIPQSDSYCETMHEATTIIDFVGRINFIDTEGNVVHGNRNGQRVTVFGQTSRVFGIRMARRYETVDLRKILQQYGTDEEIRLHLNKPKRTKTVLPAVRGGDGDGSATTDGQQPDLLQSSVQGKPESS